MWMDGPFRDKLPTLQNKNDVAFAIQSNQYPNLSVIAAGRMDSMYGASHAVGKKIQNTGPFTKNDTQEEIRLAIDVNG